MIVVQIGASMLILFPIGKTLLKKSKLRALPGNYFQNIPLAIVQKQKQFNYFLHLNKYEFEYFLHLNKNRPLVSHIITSLITNKTNVAIADKNEIRFYSINSIKFEIISLKFILKKTFAVIKFHKKFFKNRRK